MVKKRELSKERRLPQMPEVNRSEAARQSTGMASDQWNIAVSLQCAVRDALERPVSMVQAFEILNEHVRDHGGLNDDDIKHYRSIFDANVTRAREAHDAETKRIAANAGKK